jgi:hypothetical protein
MDAMNYAVSLDALVENGWDPEDPSQELELYRVEIAS